MVDSIVLVFCEGSATVRFILGIIILGVCAGIISPIISRNEQPNWKVQLRAAFIWVICGAAVTVAISRIPIGPHFESLAAESNFVAFSPGIRSRY